MSEQSSLRRDRLDLGLVGFTLVTWFILAGPWPPLRVIFTPWFLFFLPGAALIVLLKRELNSVVEFVASSFLVSIAFIVITRVILSLLSRTVSSYFLIDEVVFWSLPLLSAGYVWDSIQGAPRSIPLDRSDLSFVLLLTALYIELSVFALTATYTPTPDELTYVLQARTLNLEATMPVIDPGKIWPVNFALSRPLWFISLGSYLLASGDPPFTSQVVAVFFFSMLVVATYRVAKRVFGGRVGLTAGILISLSPSLPIWGSTVLLDVPFAVFLILGYGYYLESIRLRDGRLERVAVGSFLLTIVCFLLASLVKLADPVLPALVYVHFTYLIWRSKLPARRVALPLLIGLPALYLTLDGLYNIFTYVVPNTQIHDVIRPVLPVSFFERFFAFFYQSSAYKPIAAITPLGILQGVYVAGLAPFLIMYPILLMAVAGGFVIIDSIGDSSRVHAVFSLPVVALGSFLAAVLLYDYEIPRNVIYIYPFIIIAAAVGLNFSVAKRIPEFLLSATGLVVAIVAIESTMLVEGINLGAIPAPNQYMLSIFTLNFVVGAGIVVWKTVEGVLTRRRRGWRPASSLTGTMVAIAVICLVCLSQFSVFAQTSPYRSTSNFAGLSTWLDSNVRTGDVILTNGQPALMSLVNDTVLRLIYQNSVRLVSLPDNSTALLSMTVSSAYNISVIFKQDEYTDSTAYSPELFAQSSHWVSTLVDTPNFEVSALSAHASNTTSIINVFTVNAHGQQISGYYIALLQSDGKSLESCFSPCLFSVSNGNSYAVGASSFGSEQFNHWQNDSSTGLEKVTISSSGGDVSLTAVYAP